MIGDVVYNHKGKIIRVGDIVTTYYKGYHRVISYKDGLLTFEAVMSEKMTRTGKVVRYCDVHWCNLADKEKMITQLTRSLELVDKIFGDDL